MDPTIMVPPDLSPFQPFDFSGFYDDDEAMDHTYNMDYFYHQRSVSKGKQMEINSPMFDFQVYSPLFLDFGVCHHPNYPSNKTPSHVVPLGFDDPNAFLHEDHSHVPKKTTSVELLSNYWTGMFKKAKPRELVEKACQGPDGLKDNLSTLEILRAAGARYVQFPEQSESHLSILTHPFGIASSGLSEEDTKEIELVQFLLAATEKVGDGQLDRASRLLSYCEITASKRASPVQRVVLFFTEALREKIDVETRRVDTKVPGAKNVHDDQYEICTRGLGSSVSLLKCHSQTPFSQVTQFAGVQSIIEHTSSSKRIHVIDLEIRSGMQWIILMEALVERIRNIGPADGTSPNTIELLRITAVVSNPRFRREFKETGDRLADMAESMNIPFSYGIVEVPGLECIRGEMFGAQQGETVVVYACLVLRSLIVRPDKLEGLMWVLKSTNPAVMVVTEVEANHNSPSFMERFIEALFSFGAYLDCVDECLQDGEHKFVMEEILRRGIWNMIGKDGEERVSRSVKVEVWRAFFKRVGMAEVGLSESSLYQASLVAKSKEEFAGSCSLQMCGKGLIVGWKGTPILSISAWSPSSSHGQEAGGSDRA